MEPLEETLARIDDDFEALATLEATLTELEPSRPLDGAVMNTVSFILALHDGTDASSPIPAVNLSQRQLRRRFRRHVGLSQKELHRIQRLRRSAEVAARADCPTWVEIAVDHGFADQSHLVREYRRLLGLTPGSFAEHASRIRHGRIVR